MSTMQKYRACVAMAPNFRIGIEYVALPTVQRVIAWHGKRPTDVTEITASVVFAEGTSFEAPFDVLLTQAVVALQTLAPTS